MQATDDPFIRDTCAAYFKELKQDEINARQTELINAAGAFKLVVEIKESTIALVLATRFSPHP